VSSYGVALTASAEKELHRLPAKVVARIMPPVDVTRIAHRREVYE
jgi:hypothetical protein